MRRTIKSRPNSALAGLRRSHEERRQRTLHIVGEAIRILKLSNSPITLGRIAETTKGIAGTGRGVSESTILRNAACRELYEKEAQPTRRPRSARRALASELEDKPTEVEARRMHYLLRLTKTQLVALIVKTERELKSSTDANSVLREEILLKELGQLV